MPAIEISHCLDLGPELPDDIKHIALEQGEDPDRVPFYLDELKNMISGKLHT